MATFAPGSRVSILATAFDVENEPRWSQQQFGADWKNTRIFGAIKSAAGKGKFEVVWDDGDVSVHCRQQLRLEKVQRNFDPTVSESDSDGTTDEDEEETTTKPQQGDNAGDKWSCHGVQWTHEENLNIDSRNLPKNPPSVVGLTLSDSTSVADIFEHLLPVSIAEICRCTNAKATQMKKRIGKTWSPVTTPEMLVVLAILFAACQVS